MIKLHKKFPPNFFPKKKVTTTRPKLISAITSSASMKIRPFNLIIGLSIYIIILKDLIQFLPESNYKFLSIRLKR